MMQVNLSAPVMLAKTLVAASEGKRPAIVHIVDQRVVHPVPDQIAYSLSKSALRSEEHTSELQSLMRISYAVFCLKKKNNNTCRIHKTQHKQCTIPHIIHT